jgi:Rrf2 family protein
MLKLAQKSDDAVRIVRFLSAHASQCLPAERVASALGISQPMCSKIMKLLLKGGVLKSRRGATGGYYLSRQPQDISLWAVLQAVEGVGDLAKCLETPEACAHSAQCAVRPQWQQLNNLLQQIFTCINFAAIQAPLMEHPLLQSINQVLQQHQQATATKGTVHG